MWQCQCDNNNFTERELCCNLSMWCLSEFDAVWSKFNFGQFSIYFALPIGRAVQRVNRVIFINWKYKNTNSSTKKHLHHLYLWSRILKNTNSAIWTNKRKQLFDMNVSWEKAYLKLKHYSHICSGGRKAIIYRVNSNAAESDYEKVSILSQLHKYHHHHPHHKALTGALNIFIAERRLESAAHYFAFSLGQNIWMLREQNKHNKQTNKRNKSMQKL